MTIFIGIDPGLEGAISFIYPADYIIVDDLPVLAKAPGGTIKSEIDVLALRKLLRLRIGADETADVTIEYTAPFGKSVLSAASLEATKASIMATVLLSGYTVRRIRPQLWQKFYGIASDAVGCNGADTKEQSRLHAVNLFGSQYFTRKKDHNRADAALIARYALRHFA